MNGNYISTWICKWLLNSVKNLLSKSRFSTFFFKGRNLALDTTIKFFLLRYSYKRILLKANFLTTWIHFCYELNYRARYEHAHTNMSTEKKPKKQIFTFSHQGAWSRCPNHHKKLFHVYMILHIKCRPSRQVFKTLSDMSKSI